MSAADSDGRRPRGRYAPSPTGELHLGNASTALLAWLSVRARGGRFVIRIEDLDGPRVVPGASDRILEDLEWLGLDWDEGPDLGGPAGPYAQSLRAALYRDAFERLVAGDRVYPCFCSRRDIASAASAPQEPGDELRYPGTCRALSTAEAARRVAAGRAHAWRFRVGADEARSFEDLVRGSCDGDAPGDFVVRRADGTAAYQLAVVVDDAAMSITEVVRGDDLIPSAMRQLLLYRALDLEPPAFGHVPLLLGPDGVRLSKRHAGSAIRELRGAGLTAERIVGRLAHLLGLRSSPSPVRATELVPGFSLRGLAPAPRGIRIDPSSL